MKKRLSKLLPFLLSVLVFLIAFVLSKTNLIKFLELKSYDAKVRFTANFTHPSEDIVLIIVDQDSIDYAEEEYGWSFPWPRSAYGKIFKYLDQGEAASVTFDIMFDNPSAYGVEDDLSFAEALKSAGFTKSYLAQHWDGKTDYPKITKPIKELEKSAFFISNTTSLSDSDGIIRRVRVRDEINGNKLTFMGFAPLIQDGPIPEKMPFLQDDEKNGKYLKLNYKGDIDLYPHYSAAEILESIKAIENGEMPEFEPENFTGSHVFVIYYAPGLFDICATPISKKYPGAGVSVTTLDNLLNNEFIKEIPAWSNTTLLYVVILLGVFFSYLSSKKKTSAGVVLIKSLFFFYGLIVIICVNAGFFFAQINILLIPLILGFILSYIASAMIDYLQEGKQRRFIQNAFSQYLSPAVIGQLIENPEKLALGGERKEISIFFSDVQSFTTLSEGLSPANLTALLNHYLEEMSSIILNCGGTIDKFEGDAIIAFWNAPIDIPNHSVMALEAAVKCQERLKELEQDYIEKIGRPMWTRIGLNTGDAIVGNMGCKNRFDYTMLGDSVNLASRLEGLNKQFGTYIMCSENTKLEAEKFGINLKFREIGKVQVVGKKEAVKVFEPMTSDEYFSRETEISEFLKGLEMFYKGDIEAAKNVFEGNRKDSPSLKYAEKCRKIIESAKTLDSTWQGIWVADSK